MTAQRDNELWRFSLAVYVRDGVSQECLTLQDTLDIDVNVLLFCAWTGARGVVLSKVDIATASHAVSAWQEKVIRPLRGVRCELKSLSGNDSTRPKVKEIELEAEQIEQAMLFAHWQSNENTRAKTTSHDAIEQNVKEYIATKSSGAQAPLSAPHLIDAARRFGPA